MTPYHQQDNQKKSDKAGEPKQPVCPYCNAEMTPAKYVGYYDEFYYWECRCDQLPNAGEHHGQYV